MNIYQQVKAFREALLRGDEKEAAHIIGSYRLVSDTLRSNLTNLMDKAEALRAKGKKPRGEWLLRQQGFHTLIATLGEQLQEWGGSIAERITEQQAVALKTGQDQARQLLLPLLARTPKPVYSKTLVTTVAEQAQASVTAKATVGVSFGYFNRPATESLVGVLADGTPVAERIALAAEKTQEAVHAELLTGFVRGDNPVKIAQRIEKVSAVPLQRALTISRTESLRAWRSGSLDAYRKQSHLLAGWRWICHLGPTACSVCIALHGTIHPLSEDFASHPNCRCCPAPVLIEMADDPFETGDMWLRKQPEEDQVKVLGKGAAQMFRDGTHLLQFIAEHDDPDWGTERTQKSLRRMKAEQAKAPTNPT